MTADPRPLALLVTPVLPRPDGCGRELRAWTWVRTLSRDARVHAVVTASPAPQQRNRRVEGIEKVWWLETAQASRSQRRLGQILPFLAGRRPELAADWRSVGAGGLPSGLEQVLAANAVSRIVVFRVYLHDIGAAVARLAPSASRDLDMDDLEPAARRSIAAAHIRMREPGRAMLSLAGAWQYASIINGLAGYRHIYLAAPEDVGQLRPAVPASVHCRANRLSPMETGDSRSSGSRQLLFVGTLNYPPNMEAVRFIARHLMPRLRRRSPDLRTAIVGRGAPTSLVQLVQAADGVDFLGAVDDLDRCYRESFAAIIPVRAGGGTKLKTIEAFARGMPVISTGHGVRGLRAAADEHYLHADTSAAFCDAVVRLAGQPALADRIARNARQLFDRHFRA